MRPAAKTAYPHCGSLLITPLTGLRGVAAMLVIVYHFHASEHSVIQPFLKKAGFLGIAIFFTLSGYILTNLYFSTFTSNVNIKEYYNFLVKRVARIYPLHFTLLILMLFFYPSFINPAFSDTKQLLGNIMLTHAWGFAPFSFIEASWTISIEFLFYLTFPFLILVLTPRRALLCLAAIVPCYALVLARIFPISPLIEPYVNHRLFTYGSFFILGACMWYSAKIPYIARQIDNNIVFIGCCIMLVLAAFHSSDLVIYLASAVGIPLIIRSAHTSKAAKFVLGLPPIVWLGLISYSLYMLHQLIQRLVQQVNQGSPSNAFYEWASIYCLIFLTSTLSFFTIELPARAEIRKRCILQ